MDGDNAVSLGDVLKNMNLQEPIGSQQPRHKTGMRDVRSLLSKGRRQVLIDVLKPYEPRQIEMLDKYAFDFDTLFDHLETCLVGREPIYRSWTDEKNPKKKRVINNPDPKLRQFLDECLTGFIRSVPVHESCHAWDGKWDPKSSLQTHIPFDCVFSFDLKDAYPNTSFRKVARFYYQALPDTMDYMDRRDSAATLAVLSTVRQNGKRRRELPQGSPISPFLFNRIFTPVDITIAEACEEMGFTYSRFGDDLVISSPQAVKITDMLGSLDLIRDRRDGLGFPIAEHKVFFQRKDRNVYLLGCKIVNGEYVLKKMKQKGVTMYEDGDKELDPKVTSVYLARYQKGIDYESWEAKPKSES